MRASRPRLSADGSEGPGGGPAEEDAEGRLGAPVPGSARPVVNNPGGALTKTFAALRTEAMQILLEPPAERRRGPGERRQSAPWIEGDGRSRPSCRSLDGIPIVRSRRQGTLGHGGGEKPGGRRIPALPTEPPGPMCAFPAATSNMEAAGNQAVGN
jgi:hypothetical protein